MKIGLDEGNVRLAWYNDDGGRVVRLYVDGWPITCAEQADETPPNQEIWAEMFKNRFRCLTDAEIRSHREMRS